MFFPCLDYLKREKIPSKSVELFDWWLGTRRQNTLNALNPLQFSLDCEIDVQHSLKLFSHAVFNPNIKLLRRKYTVYCPVCSHKVFRANDIINEHELCCDNCGSIMKESIIPDCADLSFELLKTPQPVEANSFNQTPVGANQGNAPSLRVSTMSSYINEEDDIRRLYDCL